MSGILAVLLQYILKYNVGFLGVLIILQGVGVPTCPSLFTIALGAFSFAGDFNIIQLFFEIWIMVTLGDAISYWIWRKFGQYILVRFRRISRYFTPKIDKTEKYLKKRGKIGVFITRFLIAAMAPIMNAVAGITGYNFKDFIIIAAFGDVFWTAIYLGIGYWFGDSWEMAANTITEFSKFITLILLLVITLYVSIKYVFKIKKRKTSKM